jgi:polysaccharide export outer membrane protein
MNGHRNREKIVRSSGLLLIFSVLFLGVSSHDLFAQVQERLSAEYRIGAQDLLEISVFGLEALNKTVRVSEDGKIALPLIGEVLVDDMTKSEVEKKLSALLKEKYLQDPQVSVFIREYQSKKVSLIGAVRTPGPYDLLGRQTLLQIISQAGGLTNEAGNEIIVIREHKDGTNESRAISIEELIMKGNPELNIALAPNDIISVPIDKTVSIYVFGRVRSPGAFEVRQSRIPTLLQAIAQAGGFSERASKSRVLIKRIDANGKGLELKVNVRQILKNKRPDVKLKANDVVHVGDTVF